MKQKIIGALTCLLAVCMVSGLFYADEADSAIAPDDQAAEYAEDDLYLASEEEESFSEIYAPEISVETEENADNALPGEEPVLMGETISETVDGLLSFEEDTGEVIPEMSGAPEDENTWDGEEETDQFLLVEEPELLNAGTALPAASGTIGDSVTWEITGETSSRTLTISGNGRIEGQPWEAYRDGIVYVVIEDGITEIGTEAFYGCTKLLEISIPESVTAIRSAAFKDCKLLRAVSLPAGLTYMGWHEVFSGCSSLLSVDIPEGIDTIYETTFSDCGNLRTVSIPVSVKTIEDRAFSGCSRLETVYYAGKRSEWNKVAITYVSNEALTNAGIICEGGEDTDQITAQGNCGTDAVWKLRKESSSEYTLIIEGTGAMKDFESSKKVPWTAYRDKITDVIIGEGVTTVGDYAFYYCESLIRLTLPASLVKIGDDAFCGCTSLAGADLPPHLKSFGKEAFRYCKNLTSITIPEGITRLPNRCFYNCKKLSAVKLPGTLTSIGQKVFYKCAGLSALVLPGSLESIEKQAFQECKSLSEIALPSGIQTMEGGIFAWSGLERVTIPDGWNMIPGGMFYQCTKLERITLPESLILVDTNAFIGCSRLSVVNYRGGKASWENLAVNAGNIPLLSAKVNYNCFNIDVDVVLSRTGYTYDGSPKTPAVTVTAGGRTLKKGTDYTVSYSRNKNVGTASVTVAGKGDYSGKVKTQFTIRPRMTTVRSLKAGAEKFTLKWSKRIKQSDGYQIQYATGKYFDTGRKSIMINDTGTVSKVIKGLKAGQKYYVRIRCFKEVSGKTYYSKWSDAVTVKVK